MTNNLLGSLIGLVGIVLALITHMMVKDLTYDVDFLMILFGRFVFLYLYYLSLQLLLEKITFYKLTIGFMFY